MTFSSLNVLTMFIYLINLIDFIDSNGITTSPFPVSTITTASLWQPTLDICQDPVHGGFHIQDGGDIPLGDEAWIELRIKMREFHHILLVHKRRLERKTCINTLELIRNNTLHDFITIDRTYSRSQGQTVQIYKAIAEMTYIFSVLDSPGSSTCCLENRHIYTRLGNQILPEVYNIVAGDILNWPIRDCVLEIRTLIGEILSCEHIHSLILLVYKYGLDQSEQILHQL